MELCKENELLKIENEQLKQFASTCKKEISKLNTEIEELKCKNHAAEIKELDFDIYRHQVWVDRHQLVGEGDTESIMVWRAMKEKLERLELEKARLRTEG